MLIDDPLWWGEQCWLDQPGEHEATVTAPESGELNSQHERELNRSEGSGMLIGDPLWWGEQYWLDQPGEHEAAVTAPEIGELNSQHAQNPDAQKGAACS